MILLVVIKILYVKKYVGFFIVYKDLGKIRGMLNDFIKVIKDNIFFFLGLIMGSYFNKVKDYIGKLEGKIDFVKDI